MSTIFAGPIEKRVMKFVRSRIADAEKNYTEGCKELDQTYEVEVAAAETRCETGKEVLADKLVGTITDKFL